MRCAILGCALTLALAACGGDPVADGAAGNGKARETPVVQQIRIVDTVSTLRQHPDFSSFAALIQKAGLTQQLSGKQPVTIFAPANSAFDKLTVERRVALLDPANRNALVRFVTAHVLIGRASARDLGEAIDKGQGTAQFKTLSGQVLTIGRSDLGSAEPPAHSGSVVAEAVPGASANFLQVSEAGGGTALVIASDIEATNGVIHVLESVLIP